MTSSNDRHQRLIEAIRNYKPSEEDRKRFIEWMEDFNAYMKQEEHDDNCHCARCMSEFLKYK
jgi:hypothetical protein